MSARRMVGTNMKMTVTPSELRAYLTALRAATAGVTGIELFVLPPHPSLAHAAAALEGSPIRWGAQDVFPTDRGPHTGEVSAPMLADLGCHYVLVGHFERRRDRGEDDELVARKAAAAQRWQMTPIVAIGESAAGSFDSCFAEVRAQLASLAAIDHGALVLAYEPGWAIGSGAAAASPEWIAQMHGRIRREIAGRTYAGSVPIITGGSLTLEAAPRIDALPDVDGLFVGRNALDPVHFARLIRAVSDARVRSAPL